MKFSTCRLTQQIAESSDSGIVDEDVDGSELISNPIEALGNVFFSGNISLHRKYLSFHFS